MITKTLPKTRGRGSSRPLFAHKTFIITSLPLEYTHTPQVFVCVFEHGPNNVSRWMTWLPISLKNAAKCDKWYQLQNHSITESLNAKGAWEKLFTSHPRACRILSVEQNTFSLRAPFIGRAGDDEANESP